ncbi:uncharacterized protein Z518_10057 [Rhinocladiella mackenziei CBS 650.93]|uniref:Rhinocladiella mackenziei CBS 650.93 unplaced genomic scaffold supercont1.8, whole genome shotgun sequence n=1 Tax=Rhinocladiella mackenziei CBS 650.93 TaxID=1442369 RepID=A0A0D2ICM9_9EURO|nr:uncharacterized protein Z518_10057 [Rhinocladiella mackenziei CBS 650.93]KIX00991.1 hypothetical protein Z518_10057 [Rhinocladiella mackenziei CBS 650.93]
MAQGQIKKPSKPTSSKSSSSKIAKKGSRTITPKKAKLLKQAKLNKKYTAGLTAKTEAMLGERAGHLEMLGHGRKKNAGVVDKGKSGGSKKSGKEKKQGLFEPLKADMGIDRLDIPGAASDMYDSSLARTLPFT